MELPLCKHVQPVRQPVASVAVGGGWLFAGLHNGIIIARALAGTTNPDDDDNIEFVAHTGVVRQMAALPASTFASSPPEGSVALITCSGDGTAKRWQFPGTSGGWQMTYQGHDGAVESFALDTSVTPPRVVTGGADGGVRVWDSATGSCAHTLRCHAGRVVGVTVPQPPPADESGNEAADPPPTGVVLTASDDGLAKMVELRSKSVLAVYSNEGVPAADVAYLHPEVYVAGTDGKIRAFALNTAVPTRTLKGHSDAVNSMLTVQGELFSAADDCSLLMWDIQAWAPKQRFGGHEQCVSALATNEQGELVTSSFDGTLRVWDRQGVVDRIKQAAQLAAEEAAEKARREREAAKEAAAKKAPKKGSAAAKGKGRK